MFTKLFASILDSSIWLEDGPTRLVWITMLAMADSQGVVHASVGGLAHRSRVTREECERALAVLTSPDPDSRDRTTGERIATAQGGWLVLNYSRYRNQRTKEMEQARLRVAAHRAKKASDAPLHTVTAPLPSAGNDSSSSASSSVLSSDSETQKPEKKQRTRPPEIPEGVQGETWADWLAHRRQKRAVVSDRVVEGIRREAAKIGWSLEQALAETVARGWQGFNASWINGGKRDTSRVDVEGLRRDEENNPEGLL